MGHMNVTLFNSMAGDSDLSNSPNLNVVLAYEDYAAGIDAVRTLSRLAQRPVLAGAFDAPAVWPFQTLAGPALRSIAAQEAAMADLIIVAAHCPGPLPIPVRQWIELWLGLREPSPAALVALLDGVDDDTHAPASIEPYLLHCAERAGMDFFAQRVGGRRYKDEYDFAANAEQTEHIVKLLEQVVQRPRRFLPEAEMNQYVPGF